MPALLLDSTGGLCCLATDLLSPMAYATSCNLEQLRVAPSFKTTAQHAFGVSFPTCMRQYCIQSVYLDGPYWMGNTSRQTVDQPFLLDGKLSVDADLVTQPSKHPIASLRAIFDVVIFLDLALKETSYDR